MRRHLPLLACILACGLIIGCSAKPESARIVASWPHAEFERTPISTGAVEPLEIASAEPATPTAVDDIPPDDPSIPRVDVNGRDPEEVVLDLIDAGNNADWDAAYSLYAYPEVTRAVFEKERSSAREIIRDFTIFESRVMDEDSAAVRVAYSVPATGMAEAVVISAPGEWWGLSLVDGEWKVNWLPRQ